MCLWIIDRQHITEDIEISIECRQHKRTALCACCDHRIDDRSTFPQALLFRMESSPLACNSHITIDDSPGKAITQRLEPLLPFCLKTATLIDLRIMRGPRNEVDPFLNLPDTHNTEKESVLGDRSEECRDSGIREPVRSNQLADDICIYKKRILSEQFVRCHRANRLHKSISRWVVSRSRSGRSSGGQAAKNSRSETRLFNSNRARRSNSAADSTTATGFPWRVIV